MREKARKTMTQETRVNRLDALQRSSVARCRLRDSGQRVHLFEGSPHLLFTRAKHTFVYHGELTKLPVGHGPQIT
jgi:hypothetical protein